MSTNMTRRFSLELEDRGEQHDVDWAAVVAGLGEAAAADAYFILADASDASGMTYMQGVPTTDDQPWTIEFQGGSLDDHWTTQVPGGTAMQILRTWMTTGDWRSWAHWVRLRL